MNRAVIARLAMTLGWLATAAWCSAGEGRMAPARPNIVLLFADDLGYGELGCQGNPEIPTPHIDSIASGGIRFTSGYVTAPFCSASRAGMITGRYQTRFGYELNPIGARNVEPGIGLPASERTLAEALHDAGYATGLVGKWHLGGSAPFHPQRHGFDEFFGFLQEGHFFVPPPYRGVTTMLRRRTLPGGGLGRWTHGSLVLSTHMGNDEPPYDANNPILRGSQPVDEPLYLTDAFTREALEFIDRNQARPFFLYLAYNAVHSPLQGAEKYMNRFEKIDDVHRRIFAAMLANLDDSVGAVLGQLRRLGLEERTLVFFVSDNGGPTRELTSSNLPLRGGKGDVYEGGLRVPFMMQWTGTLPAGVVDNRPVISLDIFATAAAIGGAKVDSARLDGVDLIPYLTERREDQPHAQLYWRVGRRSAYRDGDWKLVRNDRRKTGEWQLFNLAEDMSEQHDLAAKNVRRLADLVARWQRLNDEMVAPLWQSRVGSRE